MLYSQIFQELYFLADQKHGGQLPIPVHFILEELTVPTNEEKGCIQIQAYPLDVEKRQIMLWEIWENEQAVHLHHQLPHTVACAQQGFTSLEWMLESEV